MSDTPFIYLKELEAALPAFAALHTDVWYDLGPAMTCSEVEALYEVFHALAMYDACEALMSGHATGDSADNEDGHEEVIGPNGWAIGWRRTEMAG